MSLGYALLHRPRIEAALQADTRKRSYDEFTDLAFGTLGAGDLGPGVDAFIGGRRQAFDDLGEQVRGLFEAGEPLAFMNGAENLRFESAADLTELLSQAAELAGNLEPAILRERVHAWLDRLFAALPALRGDGLTGFLTGQIEEATRILEQPRRSGRRDMAAHRAFRAAATLRQMLKPGLAMLAGEAGQIDLESTIRTAADQIINRLQGSGAEQLTVLIEQLRGEYGGLLEALGGLSGSVSVSAGAEGMPEVVPEFLDEVKAVPHGNPADALWVLDLVSNIFTSFFLIWELVRTDADWSRRWFDGPSSIILILWQVVHTVLRAAAPDAISYRAPATGEPDGGRQFLNWLFTDQGNFSVHLLFRFLASLHDATGPSNWAMSFARRMLQYYTSVVNPRIYYWFFRSLWYFNDWRANRPETGDPEPVSWVRVLWWVWTPASLFSGLLGFIYGFAGSDEFAINDFSAASIVLLILSLGGLLASWLANLLAGDLGDFVADMDWKQMWPFWLMMALTIIGGILILSDVESEDSALAWGLFIGLIVLMLPAFIVLPILSRSSSGANKFFLNYLVFVFGLIFGLALPYLLWRYYIDDGRDSEDDFDGMDAATSPYLLPYRAGESWLCGQGFHGLFSHLVTDSGNHFAYDFNEDENQPALMARDALVIDIEDFNPNGGDEANYLEVQHLSWVPGHDPGSDDERVLTHATYYHLSQHRIRTMVGQRVVQGYHFCDIDSTGISAQHHLHFSGYDRQRRRDTSVPVVFRDESLRRFRNFPLLAVFPGKGRIQGKPLAMAFYESENQVNPAVVNPLVIALEETGSPAHMHWLLIDQGVLGTGPLPASVTLHSTVSNGHYHSLTLTREQMALILTRRGLSGLTTTSAAEHSHAPAGFGYPHRYVALRTTVADSPKDHSHVVEVDQQAWGAGSIPASPPGYSFTSRAYTDPDSSTAHDHQITLSHGELTDVLYRQTFPPGKVVSADPTDGHEHTLTGVGEGWFAGSYTREVAVTEPPTARLLAEQPAPYQLVGDQLAVRVNERAIEYYFYGADRAVIAADVALDRGLEVSDELRVAGSLYRAPAPVAPASLDITVRGTARLMSVALRSGSPARQIALRVEPVIVIETRRRGASAALQVGGPAAATLVAAGHPLQGAGAGPFADLRQLAPADLATHFNGILNNGWPTPPAGFNATVTSDRVVFSGTVSNFDGSSARIGEVLIGLYDAANTRLRATGPIPLSTGRIGINGSYTIPVLARPARVRIDTGHGAFAGNALTASPLMVEALGAEQPVRLVAGDNQPEPMARRIMQQAEGVRAWRDGSFVVVETVSAGPDATLEVTKAGATPLSLSDTGNAPAMAAPGGTGGSGRIGDTCALAASEMESIVRDAASRDALPYDPGVIQPVASIDGSGRLVIVVASGHTVEVASSQFTAGADPFQFTRPSNERLQSQVLAAPVELEGPGWIDLSVDGNPVRIPLDGEMARLDLGPMAALPAAGSLELTVNAGAPLPAALSGNEQSVAELADTIARAVPDCTVRIAYAISVEHTLYRSQAALALTDAEGLALAGFLRDRAALTDSAGGIGTDQLDTSALLDFPSRIPGVPVSAFTITPATPPASGPVTWSLDAVTGFELQVTPTPAADPLGFPAPPAYAVGVSTASLTGTLVLPVQAQDYLVEIRATGGTAVVASAQAQLSAGPAMVRTRGNAHLPVTDNAVLSVTVLEPAAGGATIERSHQVDLTGASDLDTVAAALNGAIPACRAWVARLSSGADRLHLETRHGGTGWGLRLDNPPLLVALGFDRKPMDLDAGTLLAMGRGQVRDQRAVTPTEISQLLERARICATGQLGPGGAPQALQVDVTGSTLELSSLEGQVTVETPEPSLPGVLGVNETSLPTTLSPAANVALPTGSIVFKAAGRTLAVVSIYADHATLKAPDPLPAAGTQAAADMLALLQAHPLGIDADGAGLPPVGPVPAGVTSLEDAVEWYAGRRPEAWIGLQGGHLVVQSRGRGNNRRVQLDFSAFPSATLPAGAKLLGYAASALNLAPQVSASGSGNVAELETVTSLGAAATTLQGLIVQAAREGASRQAVYDAELDTSGGGATLRLRANLESWTLLQGAAGPGGLQLAHASGGAHREIEQAWATDAVEPGVLEVELDDGSAVREVRTLVVGEPARLPDLELPPDLTDIHDKGVRISVGTAAHTVRFRVPDNTVTAAHLAAQIERQCAWEVRVSPAVAGILKIESAGKGSDSSLELAAPASGTPNAVTNDPTTGMTFSESLPHAARGSGTVPDLAAVTAQHYRDALLNAYILDPSTTDSSTRPGRAMVWRGYRAGIPGTNREDYFELSSRRAGCISAVEPVVYDMPGLPLNRSLERAPAIRGSVKLSGFSNLTQTESLSGTLLVQLNDNGGVEDLPPAVTVAVEFPAADYTARDVARRLHEELFDRGVGQAAAYPDGAIVVETLVPGLAGRVRIPGPDAPPDLQSTPALVQALTGGAGELDGRGWPGIGFPIGGLRFGLRSWEGNASNDAQWRFIVNDVVPGTPAVPASPGTPATPATPTTYNLNRSAEVNVAQGQSLAEIRTAVDSALRSPTLAAGGTGERMGLCLLGTDGTLYIELSPVAASQELKFHINGSEPIAPKPERPGATAERVAEPAIGLRRTHEARTLRYVRDRFGQGTWTSHGTDMDDVGWLRLPARVHDPDETPPIPGGEPVAGLRFVLGRYLMAVRADAAKTRDYHESGDMIISAGTDPDDATRHFAHQARYWINFQDGAVLGVSRVSGGDYLVDILWGDD